MLHNLFIYSTVDGYLVCFQFQAIMSNTAMNIHVRVFQCPCAPISVAHMSLLGNIKLPSEMTINLLSDQECLTSELRNS